MAASAVVTGGTGFVGANVVRRLLCDGHDVHVLVRPGHRRWRLDDVAGDVQWHVTALEDAEGIFSAVADIQPRWLFHLAAYGAYSSQTDLRRMVETNFLGTINLVEASLRTGFEAFVHTGSSSEYGFKDHAPPEDEFLEPNSGYALTKASATLYCRQVAMAREVHITTLRLYSVYGPWEEPSRLVPALAVAGLRGELPPLADPSIARDFVYVDDVVDAIVASATQPRGSHGAVYNVGTGVQTTLEQLVELVRERFSIETIPAWGAFPKRGWDTATWQADPRRISADLGWFPRHDLRTGFGKFVDWLGSSEDVLARYRAAPGD